MASPNTITFEAIDPKAAPGDYGSADQPWNWFSLFDPPGTMMMMSFTSH
jgi:hypothetical protein